MVIAHAAKLSDDSHHKTADANRQRLSHGRGINMTQKMFDTMIYNKRGNQVRLTKTVAPTGRREKDNE